MGKTTHKLRRVMSRDGSICGLHWGGCGREIETRKDASLDHIIPQSYLKSMESETRSEFKGDWNLQPMCHKCNVGKKGQTNGWPLFQCDCHYLQLTEDGEMYIHELTGGESNLRRHLFSAGAISEGRGVVFTANVGKWKDGKGERWSGFSDGSHPNLTEMGHMMTCIPRHDVLRFNWFERVRVGRGAGWLRGQRSDGRHYALLQSGRILGGRGHWCASWFDPARGHENIYYDPLTPAQKKVWAKVVDSSGDAPPG